MDGLAILAILHAIRPFGYMCATKADVEKNVLLEPEV
jgi:hypothetical protein